MFCLIDVDPHSDETYVVVPGETAAFAVPLDGVGAFLPLLAEALGDRPDACCRGCGATLPGGP